MQGTNRGFTLIELLLVISLIGILGSIVLTSLAGAREKAQFVAALQEMREIEKALILFGNRENITLWWRDDDGDPIGETIPGGSGADPDIPDLVLSTFGEYLPVAPDPFFSDQPYEYDHDTGPGEEYNCSDCLTCWPEFDDGVNLQVRNVQDPAVFAQFDEIVDGSDGINCGKIRRSNHPVGLPYVFIYNISNQTTF